MKTFFDNPARIRFVVFFALCIILCIFSLIAPMLVPNDPGKADLANALIPPSQDYPFGTDQLGRCLYSRVMTGAATSIFSAFILVGVIFTIGTFIGVLSGYYGGKIDTFFMRIVDVLLAFPGMVLAIAVAGMLGSGIVNAVIAIALISWTKYARLSRSLVLSIKEENYIHAARLGGASSLKIVARHVIPNSIGPLVVAASLDIGAMMMQLAGLSFLGLGAVPPAPEWGLMLNEGRSMLQNAPWLLIYPGSAMFMTVAIFNLFGDSVRDILDPKFQKSIIKTTGGIKNA
jgi:ABC-type dipeptide/oligopeptide/nickel transport system permease subunit